MKKLAILLTLLLGVSMLAGCNVQTQLAAVLQEAVTPSATAATEPAASTDASTSKTETVQTVIQNNITITGTHEDTAYAAAAGLRSAVSIYCTFEMNYSSGRPGMQKPTTYTYCTTGSGVIYQLEEDGTAFIVTNFHVVYDSSSNTANHVSDDIYLYLYGMENYDYAIPATYVGGSSTYDIAVLYVEKSEVLKNAVASGAAGAVKLSPESNIQPGMTTLAIGNPSSSTGELGGLSVTQGIVSVASEYITMSASDTGASVQMRVIRTDTPVNSGNSGGGLYNLQGQLVGIVNAKLSSSDLENIGYAIPVGIMRAVADNIIYYCFGTENESVMRCMLGISLRTAGLSTAYDSQTGTFLRTENVAVQEVTAGSLADGILLADDVLVSATAGDRSVEITRQYHIIDFMLDVRVGEEICFTILRDGTEMTVSITITEDCLTAS